MGHELEHQVNSVPLPALPITLVQDEDVLKPDIILNKLKELQTIGREVVQSEKPTEPKLPELAKHFLIFAVTSWSPMLSHGKKSKQQFVVARYGLKSITANFLEPVILEIISFLANYGFIVDTIVGDGASKNWSTFKGLATVSAREVFKNHFPADLLDALPSDFKIAFKHPNPHYSRILIFIGGKMPH